MFNPQKNQPKYLYLLIIPILFLSSCILPIKNSSNKPQNPLPNQEDRSTIIYTSALNTPDQAILLPKYYKGKIGITAANIIYAKIANQQAMQISLFIKHKGVERLSHFGVLFLVPQNTNTIQPPIYQNSYQTIEQIYQKYAKVKPFNIKQLFPQNWLKKTQNNQTQNNQTNVHPVKCFSKLSNNSGKQAISEADNWCNWNGYPQISQNLRQQIINKNLRLVMMRIDANTLTTSLPTILQIPPITIQYQNDKAKCPLFTIPPQIPISLYYLSYLPYNKQRQTQFTTINYQTYKKNCFVKTKKLPQNWQQISKILKKKAKYKTARQRENAKQWYINHMLLWKNNKQTNQLLLTPYQTIRSTP